MCIFQKNIFESVFPHHSTVYSMWPTLRKEKNTYQFRKSLCFTFSDRKLNKKKDNAQWLKSIFAFHCAGAIYHCTYFATTSFLQVPSVFTLSKVKAFHYPHSGVSLIIPWQLTLDSVSYLTSIITAIKNQKLFLTKILSLLYPENRNALSLNETHAFDTRYRQILWNYTANLHKKICGEVWIRDLWKSNFRKGVLL